MTKPSYILMLLLAANLSIAQIHIFGPQTGVLVDTTYYVDNNIFVNAGASLTILPGAVFEFTGASHFNVNGYLNAVGTAQDSIVFKPHPSFPWGFGGVRFYDTAADSSRFEYCCITTTFYTGLTLDHANPTISHCTIMNSSGSGISCGTSNASISDCRITNCLSSGIWMENSSPQILNCYIDHNTAQEGGGINMDDGSNPLINNCAILYNSAIETSGGGVGGGIMAWNSSPIISSCIIQGNYTNNGGGGGIRLEFFCDVNLSNCLICDNTVYNGAGGVSLSEQVNGSVTHCIFAGNRSTNDAGGGLGWTPPSSITNALVSDCIFIRNRALEAGGGIISTVNITINRCSFIRNKVYITSPVLAVGGGIMLLPGANAQITNCTLFGNTCTNSGGGGIAICAASPMIKNCIAWANYPDQIYCYGGVCNPQVTYNDVQGGWTGAGNLNQYPAFIDTSYDDYRLSWGSPCIDSGDPRNQYFDPDSTRNDMGVYYFDQGTTVIVRVSPFHIPYIIPEQGGLMRFTVRATNRDAAPHQAIIWCDITQPDSSTQGPVMGPVTVTIPAGETLSRTRIQQVPASFPLGVYNFNAYAVVGQDTSKDAFMFGKLGSGFLETESGGWFNTGEDFNTETASAGDIQPSCFSLYPCRPNPFNPTTILSFELRVASLVNLSIYDLSGRKVSELVSGRRESGSYQATFDGSNLPSGIYFTRLTAGEYSAVQKLVLLK